MNSENIARVRNAVNAAGDVLKTRLQPTAEHPERNAYAHLWRSIKNTFGASYKDLSDDVVEEVLALVDRELSNG